MSEFDERLRRVVRTIGESAPHPPAVSDERPAERRRWSGPLVALGAFAVALLVFGATRLFLSPDGGSSDGASVMKAVRHQVLEVTLMADLSCDGAEGAGMSTLRIEAWADFDAGRFRQLTRFGDGSTRDRIVLGDLNYPTRAYAKGGSGLTLPACGADVLLGDPAAGPNVLFFNPPVASPNVPGYKELGSLVPGAFTDSLDRPSILYRQEIDGFATADDGAVTPLRQVTEWYVDATTGNVLERVFSQSQVGRYSVRQTIVVAMDDAAGVDPASLSEAGYELEWSAEDAEGSTPGTAPVTTATTSEGPTGVPVGESAPRVLIEDPLVVQEAPRGPNPLFDTSGLGTERPLVPFSSLTIEDLGLWAVENPLVDGSPIVALGEIDGFRAFRMDVVALGGRYTCDWGLEFVLGRWRPLGACAFGRNPRPDVTVLVRTAGIGTDATYQVFWSGLSDEVSVVAISGGGMAQGEWQRPVGGVGVFLVVAPVDAVLDLTAYAADGDIVRHVTTENAGTDAWPGPLTEPSG